MNNQVTQTTALSFPDASATYDVRDNKLRVYFDSRLDKAEYQHVKDLGFQLAPKQGNFFAVWTPRREDFILSICEEIGDEDTSPLERAEQRADRFEEYSGNRAAEAKAAEQGVDNITRFIPMGQPILVGHHSEKRARKDAERITNGMRRSINRWETSEYWKQRAAAAIKNAERKERPDVRHRRIKKLEAEQRKCQRELDKSTVFLAKWRKENLTFEEAIALANIDHLSACFPLDKYPRPADKSQYEGSMSLWSALHDEIATPEQVQEIAIRIHERWLAIEQRWISHYENRLTYERAMLCEQEGCLIEDKWQDMLVGGKVKAGRYTDRWLNIIRVNKRAGKIVSVTTKDPLRDDYFSEWKYTLEEIKDYQAPEATHVTPKVLICNYPGEGFKEITSAQWNATGKDYKSIIEKTRDGVTYKLRYVVASGSLYPAYLTDKKVVYPPKAVTVAMEG